MNQLTKGTAVTIGKFDSFHLGHQLLIKDIIRASHESGLTPKILKLSVIKAGIMSRAEEEAFLMESYPDIYVDNIDYIDFTPEFMKLSPEEFVRDILKERFKAEYAAVGTDFQFGYNRSGDVNILKQLGTAYGITVNVIDKLRVNGEIVSSSNIRACLEGGDMQHASLLLGRAYKLSGIVEGGKKLGRSLGYPTINLGYDEGKLLPRYGVYASRVIIDDKQYSGITNIGIRPSLDDGDRPTVETFIYDFSGDIYGRKVDVIPLFYVREERHFASLEELTCQITKDIEYARNGSKS